MTLVNTDYGPAQVAVDLPVRTPVSLLVLGHGAGGLAPTLGAGGLAPTLGAGGGVDAPDLVAVRDAAVGAGVAVARVTQPYRVARRRAPPPAAQLDAAWMAAVTALHGAGRLDAGQLGAGRPLVVGGRSSGARVACRTARSLGAVGVVALAFPLHPPGRPDRSRAGELVTGVPTLVVNGAADPFGIPAAGGDVELCVRPGERHDLRRDPAAVGAVVVGWLRRHGWAA